MCGLSVRRKRTGPYQKNSSSTATPGTTVSRCPLRQEAGRSSTELLMEDPHKVRDGVNPKLLRDVVFEDMESYIPNEVVTFGSPVLDKYAIFETLHLAVFFSRH